MAFPGGRAILTPSPFSDPPSPRVIVAGGGGPYANARAALAGLDLSPARGRTVLLKPNAGRIARAETGITTHPQAVAAAIDAFREAGATVRVGESPIAGVKTLEAFEETGIAAVARERDCPLIDMDARRFVEVPVPEGRAVRSLRVCPEVLEADLVVSLPVTKMHMHTGVTLALKNMKGCLWRRSKVSLHMLPPVEGMDEKPIDVAIADLAGVLRPHLSLVDGYIGMEGLGPSAGAPRRLDAAVAGIDVLAVDAVACRLMGKEPAEVPHLRLAAARGYGTIDLDRIAVEPPGWEERAVPFAGPPRDIAIDFPNITIHDRNSCSACQSTLLLFLKRYGDTVFDYFPEGTALHFAIGKGHEELPAGTVCIGNCTAAHRERGIFVPGCPPVASAILRALSGKPAADVLDGHGRSGRET